jgi:hypothetical protein
VALGLFAPGVRRGPAPARIASGTEVVVAVDFHRALLRKLT